MIRLILLTTVLFISGCIDAQNTKRVLEDDGYKSIGITGYKYFACSGDDFYHTGFIANKNGKRISGTVCRGLFFKGNTIRLD